MSKLVALALAVALATLAGCATSQSTKRPEVSEDSKRLALSRFSQGQGHLREGKLPQAIRDLRFAVSLDPNNAEIRLALGEAYRVRGLLAEAEHELKEALAIDASFQKAHLTLSALYIQLARYEDSIRHAQVLIDDATFADVWMPLLNKGIAQLKLGKLEYARVSLEMASDFRPNEWRVHLNLGNLALQLGDRDAALAHYAIVLKHGAGTLGEAEANYRTAEIYDARGDQGRAIRHLLAVRERNPEGEWGRASVEYLKRLQ
ncbi:MAG: tetratricopeptide repeat protein [Deltaproteobacteria bacterium]|nr:tetratricopeptide repeat protein [Deltaproteobacteria bacterium]